MRPAAAKIQQENFAPRPASERPEFERLLAELFRRSAFD